MTANLAALYLGAFAAGQPVVLTLLLPGAVVVAPATVTIADGNGAAHGPFEATVNSDGHSLSVTIPLSALPMLDMYAATWSGLVGGVATVWDSSFEIVGGFIVTYDEIRTIDRAFSDTAKFPDAALKVARARAEARFERAANVAFVPRGRRELVSGPPALSSTSDWVVGAWEQARVLKLSEFVITSVYSVVSNGVALTADELATVICDDDRLVRGLLWSPGTRNIAVHYVHGYSTPPEPVKLAVLLLLRDYLAPTALPARATAQTIGDSTYRITIAGRDGATGIPEVDAIAKDFGRRRLAVG